MYDFENTENIYSNKTKVYFQEVISSYSIGNYRSATVMLYSVLICDILFKLQELKDMYNDSKASEILAYVEKYRTSREKGSRSSWEKEFIDKIRDETELLDLEDYININHLYDHRNLSAHPALNDNYDLIQPSKETTAANIKNALRIFVKPPIFIKQIIGFLVEDLKEKKEIFEHDTKEFKIYLQNKYYSKMSDNMKLKTIKTFWKFCFNLPEDTECMNNLIINRRALSVLISNIPKETIEYIKNNQSSFSISQDKKCVLNAIVLLGKFKGVYDALDSTTRLVIDNYIDKDDKSKLLAWFKYSSLNKHIDYLSECKKVVYDKKYVDEMYKHYSGLGETDKVLDFFIEIYGDSHYYDDANERFYSLIEPHLSDMNADHFSKIIKYTDENDQIHDRRSAKTSNNSIMKYAKDVLPSDFDYSLYSNFVYSDSILNPDENGSDDTQIE